jgi:hypothetical protein
VGYSAVVNIGGKFRNVYQKGIVVFNMLSSASDLLELMALNISFRYKFDLGKGRKQNATELTEPVM